MLFSLFLLVAGRLELLKLTVSEPQSSLSWKGPIKSKWMAHTGIKPVILVLLAPCSDQVISCQNTTKLFYFILLPWFLKTQEQAAYSFWSSSGYSYCFKFPAIPATTLVFVRHGATANPPPQSQQNPHTHLALASRNQVDPSKWHQLWHCWSRR